MQFVSQFLILSRPVYGNDWLLRCACSPHLLTNEFDVYRQPSVLSSNGALRARVDSFLPNPYDCPHSFRGTNDRDVRIVGCRTYDRPETLLESAQSAFRMKTDALAHCIRDDVKRNRIRYEVSPPSIPNNPALRHGPKSVLQEV